MASDARIQVACERFQRFFAEIDGVFAERSDILKQIGLALLAREHVLLTGPPGTGKSSMVAAAVGRIVCENSGAPSLFSRQITESTVQTDLIGAVDFRTLTATGRTEHFTDEGMLGAVHAFLDEVLDGRDMLLRSTLNILEERELKQGARTTRGRIESAVMTSNRYLAEVLEEGRNTLLAFVDRVAFVGFVPRGFADPSKLGEVVEQSLRSRRALVERLTIQDVDVLQELVAEVVVPPGVAAGLVELSRRFDAGLRQQQRADPAFAPTRYMSTRAVVRLGRILRALVVYDRATVNPTRSLVAAADDLGALRLALMLSGPKPDELEALLAVEREPRERRQLLIMQEEARLFRDALMDLPSIDEAVPKPSEPKEPSAPSPATSARELAEAVARVRETPGNLESIALAMDVALKFERRDAEAHGSGRAARGALLDVLCESMAFAEREPLEAHLSYVVRAVELRDRLLAQEVDNVDDARVQQAFALAMGTLGDHYTRTFDARLFDAIGPLLSEAANLETLLAALEPLLQGLEEEEEAFMMLAGAVERPSHRCASKRINMLLQRAYAQLDASSHKAAVEAVDHAVNALQRMNLLKKVSAAAHLEAVARELLSDQAPPPSPEGSGVEAYRVFREQQGHRSLSSTLVELVAAISAGDERSDDVLERPRRLLGGSALAESLASRDLDRLDRAATFFERWLGVADERAALEFVAFEEQALLRFALECDLVGLLFPSVADGVETLRQRFRLVADALREQRVAQGNEVADARWGALGPSSTDAK
ncbi:MAG: AAA family ATPase [Myxococcota bacterium]